MDYEPKTVSVHNEENSHFTVGVCELMEKNQKQSEVFVGAMVYLVSRDRMQSITEKQLKLIFELTTSEAKVCSLLMKNIPAKKIAELECKSVNTVREQIQSCYAKTGAVNQLELINLIGCIPLED